jgi:SAM-dependent methyltransferase
MSGSNSFWESPKSYDAGGESAILREHGEPYLTEVLQATKGLDLTRLRLVDFGCWSGRHLPLLERVAHTAGGDAAHSRVIGIDRPEARERLAEARATYTDPHFEIRDTGITATGLAPSCVDAAICWRVLHNLTQLREISRALCHLRRVLRGQAPLVAAVRASQPWMESPHEEAPFPVVHRSYWIGGEREDLYFTQRAARSLFELYGFIVDSIEPFTEPEWFDEQKIENPYWLLLLRKDQDAHTPCGNVQ